jgi:5'-nucleotidase
MKMLKILISNDDGVLAPGLAALRSAVKDMGEVFVVAPDSPQSAAGHSITLRHPMTVQDIRIEGAEPFDAISVDGRPADCVRLALRKLIKEPVDLVLSGINAGANVGINVFYSGTVAAAAEGAMCGITSIAFSAAMTQGQVDFQRAAKICRAVLDDLLAAGLQKGELLNVNIPALSPGRPAGVKVVRQSTAGLEDVYHSHKDSNGLSAYRLGDDYCFACTQADTDVACLEDGYVTVSPLQVDMTRHQRLDALRGIRWTGFPAIT